MTPQRDSLASSLIDKLQQSCQLLALESQSPVKANYFSVIHLSKEQAIDIIKKIVNAVPESIFKPSSTRLIRQMEDLIVKEFIFFQAQENIKDKNYPNNFLNFLQEVVELLLNMSTQNSVAE